MVSINTIKASEIKEQVSLVDLLARLGFTPVRNSGKEKLYLSMIRESDTKPSFAVNDNLNVWFDHGLGKGGNVIDFGLAYWPGLSFPDVLEKITAVCALPGSLPANNDRTQRRRAVKLPNYRVEEVKELGSNPAITEYLQSRGVYEHAIRHLSEVYYYVEDEKKLRKYFFAAGWQNELGAWEVRNKYFKGCLGHKAMTFLPGDPGKLAVFEGFLNYLSWLTEHPFETDSILVLNTITLVFAATKKAGEFSQVNLFLDRDTVGHKASLDFQRAVPQARDCSYEYEGYNDYNDKLLCTLNNSPLQSNRISSLRR
ncbi:hypothetical protein ACCC92_03035 [Mucilaginibacter sp. Mucisp84]|uniref:hypothetical protein n=1 Tax=Mucilaginibacter sp. Mucisp84 TaxID=3243058 RepID=UPI0039A48659